MNLPHCKRPCADCPFRRDSLKGWLGAERMKEILAQPSFTCHKTDKALQCAGHMLIRGKKNQFVELAGRFGIPLKLSGKELLFNNEADLIGHHNNNDED